MNQQPEILRPSRSAKFLPPISRPLAVALLLASCVSWSPLHAQTPTVSGYNGTQTFVTSVGKDPDEPNACGVVGGSSYWLTYKPPTNALVTIDSLGSSYNTVLGIYVDNGQNLGYASLVPVTRSRTA